MCVCLWKGLLNHPECPHAAIRHGVRIVCLLGTMNGLSCSRLARWSRRVHLLPPSPMPSLASLLRHNHRSGLLPHLHGLENRCSCSSEFVAVCCWFRLQVFLHAED